MVTKPTPLLKWYLLKGLVVTRIYQVVEYSPATCFQKFGEAVSDAHRAGDADPHTKIICNKTPTFGAWRTGRQNSQSAWVNLKLLSSYSFRLQMYLR
jgi:hypothetical protein